MMQRRACYRGASLSGITALQNNYKGIIWVPKFKFLGEEHLLLHPFSHITLMGYVPISEPIAEAREYNQVGQERVMCPCLQPGVESMLLET